MGEGRHVEEDVAAGEDVAMVETHTERQRMGAHPQRTTIPERDGIIRGGRPINKIQSNVSTIGTCAAAADGISHSGTPAKCAPRSATGKDT